ncbi:rod shape-determining protein MreD [Nocardiopsis sp. Huas11]|uniref:rod shape-determining protein MreD n=1 Tax=Nocardiopsis sp. Huas11 TaxID=2183912 RepID=UPI000EAEC10B|nr:rod shape-determining protein MreD [Nocardiopsis sp. Huas11]RKS04870.1 rod shape-determining protein MreD [Nocardiopsis sp. Huas11]
MRAVATVVLVAVAVLLQAVVVQRLPLPWGPGPDLVVAAVAAVALTARPATAAGYGFAAGLAMDLLPPAEHAVGRYALVLCLAAYTAALLRANTGAQGAVGMRIGLPAVVGATASIALGAGLAYAAVGFVMGDPRLTLAAVVVNAGLGALLTALVSPVVTLPMVRLRDALADSDFATVQGPTSPVGW